jgi:hypothetical protein
LKTALYQMVLHRPSEPAARTGQVRPYLKYTLIPLALH